MQNYSLKSLRYIILLLTMLTTTFVHSAEEVFESAYAVTITSCRGSVSPPDMISDYWRGKQFIHFDNGLWGVISMEWKFESQAKQYSELTYEGRVNLIVPTDSWRKPFVMVEENGTYASTLKYLWVESHSNFNFNKLPKVKAITENYDQIKHWFSTEDQYRYTIELSDGSIYLTKIRNKRWEPIWDVNSRIIKIGNGRSPCLINFDKLRTEDYYSIKDGDYLYDLEIVH